MHRNRASLRGLRTFETPPCLANHIMNVTWKWCVAVFIACLPLLINGCAVGPDFKKPALPDADGYTVKPLPSQTEAVNVPGGEAQTFVSGADIPGEWWDVFHSQPLSDLISRALTN